MGASDLELELAGAEGLPAGSVLAIKLGSEKQMGFIGGSGTKNSSASFRFASTLQRASPLKVDVYVPFAQAEIPLEVDPPAGPQRLRVPLTCAGGGRPSLDFNVQGKTAATGMQVCESSMAVSSSSCSSNSGSGSLSRRLRKFQHAMDAGPYFEQHNVMEVMQAMLHAVMKEQPTDPIDFMMRMLHSTQSGRTRNATTKQPEVENRHAAVGASLELSRSTLASTLHGLPQAAQTLPHPSLTLAPKPSPDIAETAKSGWRSPGDSAIHRSTQSSSVAREAEVLRKVIKETALEVEPHADKAMRPLLGKEPPLSPPLSPHRAITNPDTEQRPRLQANDLQTASPAAVPAGAVRNPTALRDASKVFARSNASPSSQQPSAEPQRPSAALGARCGDDHREVLLGPPTSGCIKPPKEDVAVLDRIGLEKVRMRLQAGVADCISRGTLEELMAKAYELSSPQ
mmetsp:Transcript_52035/g.123893  ORF Transcript_52035/g.123893 Transcript_52035/m.123893 type:complete len:456 (+) Transcript_52035:83-1450(+)